jgi:type IV pilus assembly protein PilB
MTQTAKSSAPSTPPVHPHRFRDEWLLRLVAQLPDAPLAQVERWREERREFVSQALMDAGVLSFEMIADLVRNAYRIESVQVEVGRLDRALLALVPDALRRRHHVVPVSAAERTISLAMANPLDQDAAKDVESVTARQVVPLFCPPGQLHELQLEQSDPDLLVYDLIRRFDAVERVEVLEREGEDGDGPGAGEGVTVNAPVVQLVDGIISQAVRMGASDIHIEHEETSSLVRYRIDGILRNMMVLPRYVATGPVVARIKIMAGLDVSVHFRPQDGRAKLLVGGNTIGLRVSTLPSAQGQKVVLRVLNEKSIQVPLDDLGFHAGPLTRFRSLLASHQGVLLVTGPTGSGKTTTLYAALRERATERVNVVTVEDPIEYRLRGITQVQVNERQGLTFPGALRSVLRQDPDVILVGEIRDRETAAVAMEAALTGHLVLSTLHTNDTVGSVVRLADLGVEPFKLASGLLGVTAQRLVRRLCAHCATPAPGGTLPDHIASALARLTPDAAPAVAEGCARCGYTGYRGRVALVEFLHITDTLRRLIAGGAADDALRDAALREGALHPLDLDALWHLARGQTSLSECLPHLRSLDTETALRAASAAAGAGATLPVETATATAATEEEPPVLVVGVDPRFEALVAALGAAGVTAHMVQSGAAALVAMATRPPAGLVVGPGLTGMEPANLIGAVRTVLGLVDLPILAMGADGAAADPAVDTLAPGLDVDALVARVRAAVDRRRMWAPAETVMHPPTPPDEADRLRALRDAEVLDTPPEDRFDRITEAAAERFDVPVATISLVDEGRQWFKSRQGLDTTESPREVSFCAHGINHDHAFVIPDARLDLRFSANPLVDGDPNVRFYAGQPIRSPDGHRVGMMCIMDRVPRELSESDIADLGALRDEVERELWPLSEN